MSAANTDKLLKVGKPGTATTLSSPGHTSGGTSITVGSTTNWPTDTGVAFAIDRAELVAGEEVQIPGTYTEWIGVVSGATTITDMVLSGDSPNSDQTYASGSLTRVYIPVSATRENKLVEWGLTHADQDGTLKAGAVDVAGVIASDLITNTQMATAVKPETNFAETTFDFVASGCVWSGDAYGSTRVASMTAGVVYIGGRRVVVSAVTSRTFTASKDVYVDVDNTGTLTYTDTTTNAASPALAANSIRLAIIVVGASNIAAVGSVNQGEASKVLPIASSIPYAVTDSLGNLICPRDPNRRILGYRQVIATTTTGAGVEETIGACVVPFIAPTGRKVKVSGTANLYSIGVAGELQLYIKESTTYLATAKRIPAAINNPQETSVTFVGTPSAGLHTYTLNYDATTNNVGTEASATAPTFLLVELA